MNVWKITRYIAEFYLALETCVNSSFWFHILTNFGVSIILSCKIKHQNYSFLFFLFRNIQNVTVILFIKNAIYSNIYLSFNKYRKSRHFN